MSRERIHNAIAWLVIISLEFMVIAPPTCLDVEEVGGFEASAASHSVRREVERGQSHGASTSVAQATPDPDDDDMADVAPQELESSGFIAADVFDAQRRTWGFAEAAPQAGIPQTLQACLVRLQV